MNELLPGLGLGAIVGIVLALTGAGGGMLGVPLLIFGLGLSLPQAAPIALLATGIAAAIGAVMGLRAGIVRYRAALLMAGFGVAFAPVGLWLAPRLPPQPLAFAFAGLLVFVSLRLLLQAVRELRTGQPDPRGEMMPCVLNAERGRLRWTLPCARALAFTGALAGVLAGLLGVGGGFVIVPGLTRYTDLPLPSIVATSLAVTALVSAGSVAVAAGAGVLHWRLGLPFVMGTVLGLFAARAFMGRLAGPRAQQAFALVGLLAAVLMVVDALHT